MRFIGVTRNKIRLQVPNTFFVDYLGDHYLEVIAEELLRKHKVSYEVELTTLGPVETPTQYAASEPPAPQVPKKEEPKAPILDQVLADLEERIEIQEHLDPQGRSTAVAALLSRLYDQRAVRKAELARLPKPVVAAAVVLAPQLRQPGSPQKQYVNHTQENPRSAFEGLTRSTRESSQRELRDNEKRRPKNKPDSS